MAVAPFIPINFDWVAERSKCSIHQVFKQLELEIEEDVTKRKSLLGLKTQTQFSISTLTSNRFSVIRVDDPISCLSVQVDFALVDGKITAQSQQYNVDLAATITLNNEGRCKLKIGNDELEHWQFRRMALEALFFGYPSS